MKKISISGIALLTLAACTSQPAPVPTLPEGIRTSTASFVDDSYLRGVRGSYNTSPTGRPAAILDVTYSLECVADDFAARVKKAKRALDQKFIVAPLYFNNPRERGQWTKLASRAVAEFGCVSKGVSYTTRTTDIRETTIWAIRNRVPPA